MSLVLLPGFRPGHRRFVDKSSLVSGVWCATSYQETSAYRALKRPFSRFCTFIVLTLIRSPTSDPLLKAAFRGYRLVMLGRLSDYTVSVYQLISV